MKIVKGLGSFLGFGDLSEAKLFPLYVYYTNGFTVKYEDTIGGDELCSPTLDAIIINIHCCLLSAFNDLVTTATYEAWTTS